MYYFDSVVEEKSQNQFILVLKDSLTGASYSIFGAITMQISSENNGKTKLKICCIPEIYLFREEFASKEEAEKYSDLVMQKANVVDGKNKSIHSPFNRQVIL